MIASVAPVLAGLAGSVLPSIIDLFSPSKGGATLKREHDLFGRLEKGFKTFEQIRNDPLVSGASHIGQDLFDKIKAKSNNIRHPLPPVRSSVSDLLDQIVESHGQVIRKAPIRRLVGIHPNPGPKRKGTRKKKQKGGQLVVRQRGGVMDSMSNRNVALRAPGLNRSAGLPFVAGPTAFSTVGKKSLMIFPTGMKDSVRIQAHMFMADIQSDSSGRPFFTNAVTSLYGQNQLPLHPLWIANPISILANQVFLRHRFTRVTVHYIPMSPTTAPGFIALGYSTDGHTAAAAATSTVRASVNSLSDSIQTAPWLPADIPLTLTDDGANVAYYNYLAGVGTAASNTAANRQFFQGALIVNSDTGSLSYSLAPNAGSVWVTFEIIFFGLGNPGYVAIAAPKDDHKEELSGTEAEIDDIKRVMLDLTHRISATKVH